MVGQYVQNYATAFCQQLLQCCSGYDSGTGIDFALCVSQQQTTGFESTLPGDSRSYASGHLILDSIAGNTCIQALPTMSCATVTASANATIANRCFGVFAGTLGIDAGACATSFECAAGYCSLPSDGGLGTCADLVPTGGPCLTADMCSQAQLRPTSYCTTQVAPGTSPGTCQPLLANGQACLDSLTNPVDMSCAAELCGDQSVCGGSFVNPSTGTGGVCPSFPYPSDAGE